MGKRLGRGAWRAGILFAVVGFAACAQATPPGTPQYKAGIAYQTINDPPPLKDAKPIVVQEFFWYGCPHCYRLDPLIAAWSKTLPKGVVFQRVPDSLGRLIGQVHQSAFYIAKALGILGQTHKALFDAIHQQGRQMGSLREIRDFYVGLTGIDPKKFDAASSSKAVQEEISRADMLAARDGITSVPTLIIGGIYKTNGSMAAAGHPDQTEKQSFEDMLKIASYLINKIQSEQKS